MWRCPNGCDARVTVATVVNDTIVRYYKNTDEELKNEQYFKTYDGEAEEAGPPECEDCESAVEWADG